MKGLETAIQKLPTFIQKVCGLEKDLSNLNLSVAAIGIERFEYNPNTNSLEIDFKLSDGTVANVSTPLQTGIFKPNIIVDTYDNLASVTGQVLFEFAEIRNSQGTKYLPGSLGGTYYPSGLYYWNGIKWINDNDKIFKGLQDLLDSLSNHVNDKNNPHETSQLINNSGRFYCYSNNRWITESDDNYGSNYYQYSENAGNGTEPIVEWEHMGLFLPKGKKIKKLYFSGKSNSNEVTDLDIRIIIKYPNPINRWKTGVDNDSEVTSQILFSGNFKEPDMTGDMTDFMLKTIDFNNFEVPENCMLSIYMRPIGNLFITRYFRATYTWEIQ